MTATDKILATLSILGLIVFTGIVVVFVRELDLAIIVLMCLAIGVYDFWTTFRKADKAGNANNARGERP